MTREVLRLGTSRWVFPPMFVLLLLLTFAPSTAASQTAPGGPGPLDPAAEAARLNALIEIAPSDASCEPVFAHIEYNPVASVLIRGPGVGVVYLFWLRSTSSSHSVGILRLEAWVRTRCSSTRSDADVDVVTIEGAAVFGSQAWTFFAACSSSAATDGLIVTLEDVAALPLREPLSSDADPSARRSTDPGAGGSLVIPTGPTQLVAQQSGKCLEATGTPGQMVAATQQTCDSTSGQQWSFHMVAGGYQIVSRFDSSLCLNLRGATKAQGARVWLSACSAAGVPGETWNPETAGNGYNLIASHSAKCMDVSQGSSADGAAILQYTCHGSRNQIWAVQTIVAADAASQPGDIAQSQKYEPATATPAGADDWGDPVDGIQLHLDESKSLPAYVSPQLPGELPHLEVQMRNVGSITVMFGLDFDLWNVEIDGIWYRSGPFGGGSPACVQVPPDTQKTEPVIAVQSDNLFEVNPSGPGMPPGKLDLKPGRHSVRVRTAPVNRCLGVQPPVLTGIIAVSNVITIDVPDLSPAEETQMLINQASVGGTRGFMAARRLVDKHPEAALDAIEAAVQVTPDSGMRSQYVELAGSLPGDAAVVFLKSQLTPEAGLFSQVTAARALLARGQPDAVLSMIQVWRGAQLVTIPRDTSGLSVANAEANLIMFLATSGDAQAMDALGNDAQAPVDVRLAVVKAFLPPPSNPNSVRTSSSGPEA